LAASKSVSQSTSAGAKAAERKMAEQKRTSFFTSQLSAKEAVCATLLQIAGGWVSDVFGLGQKPVSLGTVAPS
jgi:hypothetical protein